MNAHRAVYAASLDPITIGHLNVVERVAPLYDELIVMVAVDSRKTYTFTPEERVNLAKEALAHIPNVSIILCIGHYVAKQAESLGAQVIIRGLRNFKDLEDEQTLAEENRKICPQIETIWIPCLPHLMHVSSSMVRGHVGIDPEWEDQVARSVPAAVVLKLKEKYILSRAKQHWQSLMVEHGHGTGADEVFKGLLRAYGEPHRSYHTIEHIVNLLDELEVSDVGNIDLDAVRFAIWYHDVIYETVVSTRPNAMSNEEQSAYRALHDMKKLGVPSALIERVMILVRETAHTKVPLIPEAQVLVDLDLSTLGKPKRLYDVYENGIRVEYSWVPKEEFTQGRTKILQSFLDRPSIYSTKLFQERYERTARENLKRAIEDLRN